MNLSKDESTAVKGSTHNRTKVFISYSHKDSKFLRELKSHLGYLTMNEIIDFWDDTRIMPGSQWRDEIRKAIASANVAVLLVSADFLNSEFIAKNELPPLLDAAKHEGAAILPVIIRPCAFTSTNLRQFQAVNNPSEALSKMPKPRREEVWTKIAELIGTALDARQTGNALTDTKRTRREAKTPTSSEPSTNAENGLPLRMTLSTAVEPRKANEDYLKEGIQYHRSKRYQEALATYNYALELDPTDPYIYGPRAETYHALKENERALEDLNRAFELNPKSATAWAYALRGDVYFDMKRFRNALDDFEHALEFDPDYTLVKRRRNETIQKLKNQGEKH